MIRLHKPDFDTINSEAPALENSMENVGRKTYSDLHGQSEEAVVKEGREECCCMYDTKTEESPYWIIERWAERRSPWKLGGFGEREREIEERGMC